MLTAGTKTSEFILTALTIIGSIGAALAGILPPKYAAVASALSAAAYSVSRGIAKGGAALPAGK